MDLLTNDSAVPDACDPAETIASAIAERGWCIMDDFVAPILVAQLAQEVREAWRAGALRPAGIGRGESFKVKPEVRSDQVLWLSSHNQTGATARYMAALDQLRQALNRTLFLGLFEAEGHLSLYPPGARYRRHLDQFVGVGSRTLTCVLYLNEDWTKEDGGSLRLYTEGNREDVYLDVEPLAGRLVTFLSARFFHEVLPARRERLSVTGWLKRRDPGL
jgi:SM-20-related protein